LRRELLQPVIRVENLSHVYQPGTSLEKRALEEISLEIFEGECVAIVGETGSGKTTLIQHLNGLLKPTRGRVLIEGEDLGQSSLSRVEMRRRVGLVFQYPEHQLFEESVADDISFVLRQRSTLTPGEIAEKVKAACIRVGMDYEAFGRRSPFELSSGEMRRVALAGVFVQDPKILILDEPTVGLDFAGKQEILREIGDLRHTKKTVVIVSHMVEDLLTFIDRLIVLDHGKIHAVGTPAEVFTLLLREKRFLFLVPDIFLLLAELKEEGWDIPAGILTARDALPVLRRNLGPPVGF
jgi:energy-coupling factor transport system ATP-binding protein